MRRIYVKSVPFERDNVTLALESGVDGVIVDARVTLSRSKGTLFT